MARRRVTHSGKDKDGDITKLCSPGASWSPRMKADAINDIERGEHQYFVLDAFREVDIHVVGDPPDQYLRTDPDGTKPNNLDNLPDC